MRVPIGSGPDVLARDKFVIEQVGVPSLLLMENAGAAVAREVRTWLNGRSQSKVAVVCAGGNNGADGLVAARHLATFGFDVDIYTVSGETGFRSQEGQLQRTLVEKYNLQVFTVPDFFDVEILDKYNVVVDAVLGAGFNSNRPIDNRLERIFSAINRAPHVVAVDVPSGIDPSSGKVCCAAPVKAHVTVTFGLVKTGLVSYPGRALAGRIVLASISYPPAAFESPENVSLWLNPVPQLALRDKDGHKGSFGRAAFVAGSGQYFGAPLLCSKSFLRAGGGYARLVTSEEVAKVVAVSAPEVVMVTTPEAALGFNDVIVIGPGLGLGDSALRRFDSTMDQICSSECNVHTLIIDGDGLTLLAEGFDATVSKVTAAGKRLVLTPHKGEWARLFGPCPDASQADLIARTQDRLRHWSHEIVVVIKGASSAVVSSSGQTWINTTGNPGMGTCGSGDVLAGIIAAFACNQPKREGLLSSVGAAVFVHGLAGDIAANIKGEDGLIASDIMEAVPEAIKQLRNNDVSELRTRYFPSLA